MQSDLKIDGVIFIMTCCACPEQYDAYFEEDGEDGRIRAYVRLRWGTLTVECPDVGGKLVYHHRFDEDYKGEFSSIKETNEHLTKAAIEIRKYYEKN